MLVQTKDPTLFRDTESMLLNNADKAEKSAYLQKKSIITKQNAKINKLEDDIHEMKEMLSNLFNMMQTAK